MSKTNCHKKGFTLGLALKQRRKATQKLPIAFWSWWCRHIPLSHTNTPNSNSVTCLRIWEFTYSDFFPSPRQLDECAGLIKTQTFGHPLLPTPPHPTPKNNKLKKYKNVDFPKENCQAYAGMLLVLESCTFCVYNCNIHNKALGTSPITLNEFRCYRLLALNDKPAYGHAINTQINKQTATKNSPPPKVMIIYQ